MKPLVFELSSYLGHAPLLLRFTAMLMTLPLTGDAFASFRWRFALALCLTALLAGLAPAALPDRLVTACASAATEGLLIGLAGRAWIIALQMTGAVISSTVGLQMAAQVNPLEGQQSGLVDVIFVFAGLVLILDLGYLHMLIALPPGAGAGGEAGLRDLLTIVGKAVSIGILLAAPVAIYNVAINIAVGVANRFLPAFPISMIVMPVQILVGMGFIGTILASPALRATAREFLASVGG